MSHAAFCDQCGKPVSPADYVCGQCGVGLDPPEVTPDPEVSSAGHFEWAGLLKFWPFLVGEILVIAALALATRRHDGSFALDFTMALSFSLPVLAGLGVAVLKPQEAADALTKADGWLQAQCDSFRDAPGIFSALTVRPVSWLVAKGVAVLGGIDDEFVRTGTRLFIYAYVVGLLAYLVVMLTLFVIALFIVGGALWLFGKVFGEEDDSARERRLRLLTGSEGRLSDLSVSEPGFFGRKDIMRTDEEGNIIKPDPLLGFAFGAGERIARIDDEGNVVKPDPLFGHLFGTGETVAKIDEDGNIKTPDPLLGFSLAAGEAIARVERRGQRHSP